MLLQVAQIPATWVLTANVKRHLWYLSGSEAAKIPSLWESKIHLGSEMSKTIVGAKSKKAVCRWQTHTQKKNR